MINFHKYGFLDCKRLKKILEDSNIYLNEYNPIYLFVWADLYKPEIYFGRDFTYIKYYLNDFGFVYYPPIGKGNYNLAIVELELDAQERGIDFYMAPGLQSSLIRYKTLGYSFYENENRNTYIYSTSNFNLTGNAFKKYKKNLQQFSKQHKNTRIKIIKKEDFNSILEFIANYRSQNEIKADQKFYSKLNMLKQCMEHLYELDMYGIVVLDDEKIYGFSIASIMDNCTYVHIIMGLDDDCYDVVMFQIARYAETKTRYLALEGHFGNAKEKKRLEDYLPLRIEKYYGTFNI